ncbi:MAG: S8/S53 family peptidase [Chromatiales bacterium]|nr:S8/S53 family peptidase [Chromatiales bacterium]
MARRSLPALLALMLAACDGGGTTGTSPGNPASETQPPGGIGAEIAGPAAPAMALALNGAGTAGLTVEGVTLVSSSRVGRASFTYTYTVRVVNGGAVAVQGVTGTVTSGAATTEVMDANLVFGDMAPGASVTSSDTFTIRQDRTAPLATANLSIALSGTPAGSGSPEGVLLGGQAGDSALAALVDLFPIPARQEDVVGGVILTRLDVAIAASARVGEINAALAAINARIAGMNAGAPLLVIAVPRQADAAALDALAAEFSRQPGIRLAFGGREPVEALAPPAPASNEDAMRHLNDARYPAAWNLRRLAGTTCTARPVVLVADYFQRPVPGNSPYTEFGNEVPGVDANGIGGGGAYAEARYHGYDVLTTLAAALDDEIPTGAVPFPDCLDIRTVQVGGMSWGSVHVAIASSLPFHGKVVVNTSLGGYTCSNPCLPANLTGPRAAQLATVAASIRALLAPRADRVLWTATAGNEANDDIISIYPGAGLAAYTSTYGAAALADATLSFVVDESLWEPPPQVCPGPACFPSLTATPDEYEALQAHLGDLGPAGLTPAANLLVVGSTVPGTQERSDFSNPGEQVSAVGEGIPIIPKTASQDFAITGGTSFAAPQVAGLAAYLWMISPQLRDTLPVADTVAAIQGNATGATKQIDAYATVLSLDPAGDPDPATWVIRRTLLDPDRSGQFTEIDLTAFIARYFEPPSLSEQVVPDKPDYSEYDLNGDGYTGGPTRASFDLDRSGSTRYGAAQLSQIELQVAGERLGIDEQAVTDLDVLCYYAYSPLYQGRDDERERLLANRCVLISVVVIPGARNVVPLGSVGFAADVLGTTDPRVTWSVPGGGGTIDQNGVFTAGPDLGNFTVRARSVVDSSIYADALVSVVPTLPPGVTRVASRGNVSGGASTNYDLCTTGSPPGATEWSGSITCPGLYDSGSASGFFRETYEDGKLVAVTASGSNAATAGAEETSYGCGGSSYELKFAVAGSVRLTVNATVQGGGDAPDASGRLILIRRGVGGGYLAEELLNDYGASTVYQTFTLDPLTEWEFLIASNECVGRGILPGTTSYGLELTFSP